ncbi:unnamed protein product [Mytilus coruscus]|uniref:Uncharacterized protein n=1 Tax=Mytilus coruscus TaxID=42192 RepID=A0A6J8BK20_MYTCO|nr:unnamed protein product [Mytilus coruscus]
MNLQKELVSQEIVIDEKLESGEHKNAVWRKFSGSPIPSTATYAADMIDGKVMDFSKELTPSSECVPRKRLADWIEDADRKDSSDENDSQVEDENKLEHLSASDANQQDSLNENSSQDEDRKRLKRSTAPVSGSLDVHSIINTDQKDSSNENAPLVEDRIKQKRSSAPDVVNADPPIRRGLSASTERRKQNKITISNHLIFFAQNQQVQRKKFKKKNKQILRASGKVLSYGYTPRSNRTQNYSKDAEQMSVDSQKLNQGQPLVWVPPPPPDPPNPHRK